MPDINWEKDEWFVQYHTQNLTQEFKDWWVAYYGVPSDYHDSECEQEEYWSRCGFSLMGWNAAKNVNVIEEEV